MPKVHWKAAIKVSPFEACSSDWTLLAMGVGFYWRDTSTFKWLA